MWYNTAGKMKNYLEQVNYGNLVNTETKSPKYTDQ